MNERKIQRKAKQFAEQLLQNLAVGHEDEITAEWLIEKHPTLTPEQAEKYRLFCKQKTFVFTGCYGNGEKLWQEWIASNVY